MGATTIRLPKQYPGYSAVLGNLEHHGYAPLVQPQDAADTAAFTEPQPAGTANAGQAVPNSATSGTGNSNLTIHQPAAPVVPQAHATPPVPVAIVAAGDTAIPTPPHKKKNALGATRIPAHNFSPQATSAIRVEAKLPQCQISAVELLTFFPNHTQWPKVIMRLIGTGWATSEIAKATLHARSAGSVEDCTRRDNAVRWQVKSGGNLEFDVNDFKMEDYMDRITDPARVGAVGTYHASVYTTRPQYVNDLYAATLVDIAAGVMV